MATNWLRIQKAALASALYTLLPVISACSGGAPSPPEGALSSGEAQRAGAQLFATHCAICHGVRGDGHGMRQDGMIPSPANLTLPPWSERASAGQTFLAIRNGVPETAMAPWPTSSDPEVWQLIAYIEKLQENR